MRFSYKDDELLFGQKIYYDGLEIVGPWFLRLKQENSKRWDEYYDDGKKVIPLNDESRKELDRQIDERNKKGE